MHVFVQGKGELVHVQRSRVVPYDVLPRNALRPLCVVPDCQNQTPTATETPSQPTSRAP